MIDPRTLDLALMIFLIVAGVVMIFVAESSFKNIKPACKQQRLRTWMTTIMVVASVFIAIPVTYTACRSQIKCKKGEDATVKSTIYMLFLFILSIFLIVICSLMLKDIKQDKINCGGDTVQSSITTLLTLSCLIFIAVSISIFIRYRDIFEDWD